jgi:hypothetical protein
MPGLFHLFLGRACIYLRGARFQSKDLCTKVMHVHKTPPVSLKLSLI